MTKDVLDYFKTICSIPHPSGHEELLGNYIEEFAQNHELDYARNEIGDIIIYKEATSWIRRSCTYFTTGSYGYGS